MARLTLLSNSFVSDTTPKAAEWLEHARSGSTFAAAAYIGDEALWFYASEVTPDERAGEVWRAFRITSSSRLSEILQRLEEERLRLRLVHLGTEALLFVLADDVERAVTALTRAGYEVETPQGETVEVKCSWRAPDGGRIQAAYLAQVVTYDPTQDRWLVRLQDVRILSPLDETSRALIQSKLGCWVWVPSEARQGMTLPLKYETLTGRVRWFYSHDPRAGM